jgi:hypothetical protein
MINYSFNVEKLIINEVLFVQSLKEYFRKIQIVYQAKKFVIRSLFELIQFEIDQIVHNKLNIAIT